MSNINSIANVGRSEDGKIRVKKIVDVPKHFARK